MRHPYIRRAALEAALDGIGYTILHWDVDEEGILQGVYTLESGMTEAELLDDTVGRS